MTDRRSNEPKKTPEWLEEFTELAKLLADALRLQEGYNKIVASVPGTRVFRRQLWKYALREAKEYRQRFERLESIDEETKTRLRRSVRHSGNQLSMARRWRELFRSGFLLIFLFVVPVLASLSAILVARFEFSLPLDLFPIYLIVGLIPFSVLAGLNDLATRIPKRVGSFEGIFFPDLTIPPRTMLILIQLFLISLVGIGWWHFLTNLLGSSTKSLENFLSFTAALSFFTIMTISYETTLWFRYIGYTIVRTWIRRKIPHALIVSNLVQILSVVEDKEWTSTSTKNQLLELLEETAFIIEKGLGGSLRCGDTLTNTWMKGQASHMSAAVRDLKKWVVTPKRDTRERFIERIRNNLISASQGNWDEMEKSTPSRLTGKQWFSQAYSIFRHAIVGFGPLIIFYVAQQMPWALPNEIVSSIAIVLYLWMAISLVAILDPLFEPKISAIKDVTEIIPFVRRKKQP